MLEVTGWPADSTFRLVVMGTRRSGVQPQLGVIDEPIAPRRGQRVLVPLRLPPLPLDELVISAAAVWPAGAACQGAFGTTVLGPYEANTELKLAAPLPLDSCEPPFLTMPRGAADTCPTASPVALHTQEAAALTLSGFGFRGDLSVSFAGDIDREKTRLAHWLSHLQIETEVYCSAGQLGPQRLLLSQPGGSVSTCVRCLPGTLRLTEGAPIWLLAAEPVALQAGDLDQDGRPDLVIAAAGSQALLLLINRGNKIFRQEILPMDQPPVAVAIGDLDDDGRAEIVGLSTTQIWVWQQGEQRTRLHRFDDPQARFRVARIQKALFVLDEQGLASRVLRLHLTGSGLVSSVIELPGLLGTPADMVLLPGPAPLTMALPLRGVQQVYLRRQVDEKRFASDQVALDSKPLAVAAGTGTVGPDLLIAYRSATDRLFMLPLRRDTKGHLARGREEPIVDSRGEPERMIIADFDDDGVPEVAVLGRDRLNAQVVLSVQSLVNKLSWLGPRARRGLADFIVADMDDDKLLDIVRIHQEVDHVVIDSNTSF